MHGSLYPGGVPEEKKQVLMAFKKQPFISISNNQRKGLPDLKFVGTVYNGLDLGEYTYNEKPRGEYLLWVGRITEKKGPGLAIEVAKRVKRQLVIAAAIDPVDVTFFE